MPSSTHILSGFMPNCSCTHSKFILDLWYRCGPMYLLSAWMFPQFTCSVCMRICSIWPNLIHASIVDEVKCPGHGESGGSAGQDDCFTNNAGQAEISCSRECLGGCYEANQPMSCYACRNVWYRRAGGGGGVVCAETCPRSLLTVSTYNYIH